jgi:dienelactone hydrolase
MTARLANQARNTRRSRFIGCALFAAATALPAIAAAQPETPGPYEVGELSLQNPSPEPAWFGVRIFYPKNAPCPGAPVINLHGAGEQGMYKYEVSRLMASRGLVAATPSFTNLLTNPTQADADILNKFFEWMVQASNDPQSPIAGKVDPARYGIAGHSNGGVVFLAAASNPKIKAVIGWDAVAYIESTAALKQPSLHLVAQGHQCGGGSSQGYLGAPPPKAMGIVVGASHCDFDDPVGPFCTGVCGTPPWNQSAAKMNERYSVAFFTCLLGHDPSMAQYLNFAAPQDGLTSTQQVGSFDCLPADQCSGAGGAGAGGGVGGSGGTGDAGAGVGGSGAGGSGAGAAGSGSGGSAVGGSGAGSSGSCPAPACQCSSCIESCLCMTNNAVACQSACAPGSGGTAPGASGSPASSDDSSADDGGCGCRIARSSPVGTLALLAFVPLLFRRARRLA